MRNPNTIDEVDGKILNILQENSRMPNVEIARRLGLAPSGVLGRIRRLEKSGIIQAYETKVDGASVGLGLVAFLFITTDEPIGETGVAQEIAKIPEVQEVHVIAGEDCYLVKIRAGSPQELSSVLRNRFGAFKSIRTSRTTIVLHTFKETMKLPLAEKKQKKGKTKNNK
jgi:Lrp/AsnC family leucine-responsive transcriptional regulator